MAAPEGWKMIRWDSAEVSEGGGRREGDGGRGRREGDGGRGGCTGEITSNKNLSYFLLSYLYTSVFETLEHPQEVAGVLWVLWFCVFVPFETPGN